MASPARAASALSAFDKLGYLQRGQNLLNAADPALRARIDAAVEAGDQAALRKILAENIGLSDAPKPKKAAEAPRPQDLPAAQRLGVDPNVRLGVRDELGPMGDMPTPQVLDAYRQLNDAGGAEGLLGRLGETAPRPQYQIDLPPSMRVSTIGQTHAINAPVGTPSAVDNSLRKAYTSQMPDASPGSRAMDPPPGWKNDPEAPGYEAPRQQPDATPDDGADGMWDPEYLAELDARGIPYTIGDDGLLRRGEAPRAPEPPDDLYRYIADGRSVVRRGAVSEADYADLVTNDLQRQPFIERAPEPPRDPQLDAIADDYNARPRRGGMNERMDRARKAASDVLRRSGIPAAAAGLGAAMWSQMQNTAEAPNVAAAGLPAAPEADPPAATTADLAAETSPPPSVQTPPMSPREQAQILIDQLNQMRREAGGEVPEAGVMMKEINRLMSMSNQTMAAASRGEVATGGDDPHTQATRLLAQLNQMRAAAGGEVPQARQMMAEITRLQRMGDAQRNRRAG